MAREFLCIVSEANYGVQAIPTSPWVAGPGPSATPYQIPPFGANTTFYVRLDEGNAFSMRPRPQTVEVPYGGGLAIGAYRVSDKTELRGNLRMKLTTHIAPFVLAWASTRVDVTKAFPWTNNEPEGDLASCTIYHAIMRDDGSFRRRAYTGCKVDSWSLEISTDSQIGTLNLGLSGSVPIGWIYPVPPATAGTADPTATQFPAPTDWNLPIDPYMFSHSSVGVLINNPAGTFRRSLTTLTMTGTNTLARSFFNQRYIGKLRFTGRDISAAVRLEYQSTYNDRDTYEGVMNAQPTPTGGAAPYGTVPIPVSLTLNDGTHSMTMQLHSQNIFDPLDEDLALDDLYFQSSTLNNLWDATAGEDFSFQFT
jgi:hypothetical protein